jgi:glycine dehydrogenase subunit 2
MSAEASRGFHAARWNEPVIFELSVPGARGVLPPRPDLQVPELDAAQRVPEPVRRRRPPALPELSQAAVLRHYLRLSQETLGADLNVDVGQGTCTMKYSPKVNDQLARDPRLTELHPLQDEGTVQGILELMYRLDLLLREISGMDAFSLQPASGSQAIFAAATMLRAWHRRRGDFPARDEIVTTIFSHPSDAAAAHVAGFRIVTLPPGPNGHPDLAALRAALGPRTAGLFITNPEDTGIFNPQIAEFTRLVHEAGGLCVYDQANANGLLGIARAREAGFDACFFNLHKTFSSPHGSGGPACGALGVRSHLAPFLPSPVVTFDGSRYHLDANRPQSVGKVRTWYGVPEVHLRAYAWIMSLGAEGLRTVAESAVLCNNYLLERVRRIRGVAVPWPERRRLEQVRYSFEPLHAETGVGTEDVGRRMADFGAHYWTSHHPWLIPEPFTLEPTESYSQQELDGYAALLERVSREAYENPDLVRSAPHASVVHRHDPEPLDDPARWAVTWRAYLRKRGISPQVPASGPPTVPERSVPPASRPGEPAADGGSA